MKKIFLPVFVLTYSIIITGIVLFQQNNNENNLLEYIFVSVIFLFFVLGIYLNYKRDRNSKLGFPEDDELSKKISQKAAAVSFYFSLILWVILIYVESKINLKIEYLFSIGIIGMSVFYVISWIIINIKGLENEE